MPFGKFRGIAIADLPQWYLSWLNDLPDLRDPLLSAVQAEMERREQDPEPAARADVCPDVEAAEAIIKAGAKSLARRYHPDAGSDGDHEKMVGINLAAEWLRRRLLRELAS